MPTAIGFNVSSVLVSGAKDAILIDTGFTRADAYRIAAKVLDSGKQLKAIYISQADPDYYFGAAELKKIFPRAAVLSNGPTLAKIKANIQGKQAYWGPKMGDNAPTTALLPEELKGDRLELEGQALEIKARAACWRTAAMCGFRPSARLSAMLASPAPACMSGPRTPKARRNARPGSSNWMKWKR